MLILMTGRGKGLSMGGYSQPSLGLNELNRCSLDLARLPILPFVFYVLIN